MHIKLSQEELSSGVLSKETLEVAVEQVKVNGYVVFEKVLSDERISEMRESFNVLFDEYIERKGYNTGTNRAQMFLPFTQPYISEDVIAHPIAMSVIDQILGEDCRCTYFASDTPMPGSDYQAVHCDMNSLFPDMSVPLPAFSLVLNIPLVDTTEENGPLEIWPGGTHLHGDRAVHDTLNGTVNPHLHIERAAEHMHSEKVLMPAGSIVIRDIRMWHRGTPNKSDSRRTNIALIYNKSWYGWGSTIGIPQETYDTLSEKGKELFRFEKIGFPTKLPWE